MTTEGKPAQQSHRFKLDIMSSSPETNKQMQYLTKMSAETTSSQLTASIRPLLKPIFPLASFIGTLWLFTQSDIITFVIPVTAFGILGALAGPLLTTNKSPGLMEILGRLQRVLLWNWLNTLIFDLANQRLPEAIVEDALNKPSRPLPAGRITAPQTRVLLLATVPIVLAITYFLGAWEETALLFCLNWMYNDLKGGDENFIVRNLIIGLAFALYDEASLRVACGFHQAVTIPGYHWVAITSGVIFTTMHVQDMKDQEGDRARNRRSAPLVLGDRLARWTIAVPVLIWSGVCPLFWGLRLPGFVLPVGLGFLIAARLLCLRNVNADRTTWKLWAGWNVCLYLLPLVKDHRVFSHFIQAWSG